MIITEWSQQTPLQTVNGQNRDLFHKIVHISHACVSSWCNKIRGDFWSILCVKLGQSFIGFISNIHPPWYCLFLLEKIYCRMSKSILQTDQKTILSSLRYLLKPLFLPYFHYCNSNLICQNANFQLKWLIKANISFAL